jgi:hypothetical protein
MQLEPGDDSHGHHHPGNHEQGHDILLRVKRRRMGFDPSEPAGEDADAAQRK